MHPSTMFKDGIAKRFAGSAAGVLGARMMALVAVFGMNAVLARDLHPADFGVFVLLLSLAGVASLVGVLGINRSIIRLLVPAEDAEQSESILRWGVTVTMASGSVVGGLVGVVVLFFLPTTTTGTPGTLALASGTIVVLRCLHLVLAEAARGFHERVWANLFGGIAGGPLPHLVFLGTLLAARAGAEVGLDLVLVLYAVSYAIALPFLFRKVFALARGVEGGDLSTRCESSGSTTGTRDETRTFRSNGDLLTLGIPLMLTQVCGLAMSQADIWIAGAMAAPAVIAGYAAAQRLLGLLTIPLQVAGTAIINFVPEYSREGRDRLQRMVGLASLAGGIPGTLLTVCFLLFAESILGLVFGEQYTGSALILRILVVGQFVCLVTGPCEILLMMAGGERMALRVNYCAAASLLLLGPLGILLWGMTGLAIAIACVTSIQNLANWYFAHRLLGVWTHLGANVSLRRGFQHLSAWAAESRVSVGANCSANIQRERPSP